MRRAKGFVAGPGEACYAWKMLIALLFACSAPPELEPPPPPPVTWVDIESGPRYHGVYPGGVTGWEDDITDADVQGYELAVGHQVAWVYFSHNWFHGRDFPSDTVQMIRDRGSVPWVRLMMRSERDSVDSADPVYNLEAIRAGDFDPDLQAWGAAAAQVDGPIIAEWGTEMNGQWFSWNGVYHGRAEGAELFAETYQHIVAQVALGGADNITWVLHVNDGADPDRDWNRMAAYDPGPQVCPWVAVSVYGQQVPTESDWWSFRESLDGAWPELTELAGDRPIVLAEFGVTAGASGDPVVWAEHALRDIQDERWPALRGLSWWNETWQNDDDPSHDTEMRVAEIPGMSEVFAEQLSRGVTERPVVVP